MIRFFNNSVGTNNQANREEWIEKALKKIPLDSIILDAGAGEQQYKKLCPHLHYICQILLNMMVRVMAGASDSVWDQTRLDIISDITAIPVSDASLMQSCISI